ncbi:unnamed protein product [Didymodactylos carnosus]|uniref:Vint domain-containing protein n=1 Tax=Didymodactylos carnosus TaxID=1234261 RepID=A0A8S2I892_9BILA|nr:unnamed protein product [Didymodactylos carnosus]CAF3708633.1 unnamed protein product [Didymodactylos carnosus]
MGRLRQVLFSTPYAVKITCINVKVSMVSFDSGLVIPAWYPIRINGNWRFPHDVRDETETECQEMCSFALATCHIMIINGIECATLGHNFKGKVIVHLYYGTEKVLDDLRVIDILSSVQLPLIRIGYHDVITKPLSKLTTDTLPFMHVILTA